MASIRVGVLCDSFDPVCVYHLELCRSALSGRKLDRVYLLLNDDSDNIRCLAPRRDRWRMLVAACSENRSFIPVDAADASFSMKRIAGGAKVIHLSMTEPFDHSLCPSVEEYCCVLGLYGREPSVKDAESRIAKLFAALNPHRFAHSLAVARECRRLAVIYGVDKTAAEEAGLLHDCAKCLPLQEMQRLVLGASMTSDPDVLTSGALLHSLAGAVLARTKYGVSDEEELFAIEYHNTGHPGMSKLAMIVCLADYIEPNRESLPYLEETRRLADISLERALLLSLENTITHVISKGRYLDQRTVETVSWLKTLPAVALKTV